jgi:antitoxin CcdA
MQPTKSKASVDLLHSVREGDNLSGTLKTGLLDHCKEGREKEWLKENKSGIEAYNDRIDRNGVFASKHRRF